jgi:hypothetical protein
MPRSLLRSEDSVELMPRSLLRGSSRGRTIAIYMLLALQGLFQILLG